MQGLICEDDYSMGLEIWTEPPSRGDKDKGQFLDSRVSALCTLECSAGVVDWVLDSMLLLDECRADPRRGDR